MNDYTHAVGGLHFVVLVLTTYALVNLVVGEPSGDGDGPGRSRRTWLVATVQGCSVWVAAAVFTAHWFVVDPAGMYRAQHGTGWPVVLWWIFVLSTAASALVTLLSRVTARPSTDSPRAAAPSPSREPAQG